jgi:hypothetical protein
MGCGGSKNAKVARYVDYLLEMYPQTLSFLDLAGQSNKLTEMFAVSDKNGNQQLSVGEFLLFCRVPKNRLSIRLFSLMDMDGTGSLDFREIILTVWHLCTLDHKGLEMLVFDLYDHDQDGKMDADDFTRLMGDCYGSASVDTNPNILKLLDTIEKKGLMDKSAFQKLCHSSPQTMKQAIDMQRIMRANVLGESLWLKLCKKRSERSDAVFRPENWQQLVERVIIMDMVSRHRKGLKNEDMKAQGDKLSTVRTSQEQEEDAQNDEAGEEVVPKDKPKRKKKLASSKTASAASEGGNAAAASAASEGGDAAVEPPKAQGTYRVKDRAAARGKAAEESAKRRAIAIANRKRDGRNELGNRGTPGLYDESDGEGAPP